MRINTIRIKNFRGFADIEVPFDPQFNLIIGDNGSGKTAILEALSVAVGAYFLGIKDTDSRNIRESDIRIKTFEFSEEHQFPVVVAARGEIEGEKVNWSRELNSISGGTLSRNAGSLKRIAERHDFFVRSGTPVNMPVLAYYSTDRLWKNIVERKKEENPRRVSSRLRAYRDCLQATTTFKVFLQWFRSKEQASLQNRRRDINLNLIKELITKNIPDCKDFYYEFDEDRISGLKVEKYSGEVLPFEYLSDGMRNIFAVLADIAFKCMLLNPQLKENVLKETPGIVLIDELDLHLHPEWQKQIVSSLRTAFENLQFITTSHSPFIIQEMAEGQLIKLKNNTVFISGGDQLSLEDIAEFEQEVDNPQWSEKKKQLFNIASEYYRVLESGERNLALELQMSRLIKPYSQNPAYDAFIEQIRLTKEES